MCRAGILPIHGSPQDAQGWHQAVLWCFLSFLRVSNCDPLSGIKNATKKRGVEGNVWGRKNTRCCDTAKQEEKSKWAKADENRMEATLIFSWNRNTVSRLHRNLQVANSQSCKRVFACPITYISSRVWHTLLGACILYKWLCFAVFTVKHCIECSSAVSLFQALMSGSKCEEWWCSRYYRIFQGTVRLEIFSLFVCVYICLLFVYYLCEKYYKPIIVQYYVADCLRLTLLDLWTDWTYEYALGMELVPMKGTHCKLQGGDGAPIGL